MENLEEETVFFTPTRKKFMNAVLILSYFS